VGWMKTICILGLAVAVAAVAPLLSVPHVSAQPVPGATYTGDITGCAAPPCGTVHFTVSGDASQVEGFTASDVPGDVCQFAGPQSYPVPLDIVGNSFGPGIPGLYEVSGSFPGGGTAQGTVRLVLDEPPCDSGVLDWTAVSSFPPSPVGGIAELPDASRSSRPDHLALAGLAAAALAALVGAGWYAGRRSP
jgi:hypothetical protein